MGNLDVVYEHIYVLAAQRETFPVYFLSQTDLTSLLKKAKICGGTATSFAVIYVLFVSAAWFANKHWYFLYRYLTDIHADSVAARSSFCHCEGGKEFYWKQLKRNRILRDLSADVRPKVTPSGDIRGIATSILVRYDHLKDLNEEDEELKDVIKGDD